MNAKKFLEKHGFSDMVLVQTTLGDRSEVRLEKLLDMYKTELTSGLQIEVGKYYEDACGRVQHIIKYEGNSRTEFPYTSAKGFAFRFDGQVAKWEIGESDNFDLIKEVNR